MYCNQTSYSSSLTRVVITRMSMSHESGSHARHGGRECSLRSKKSGMEETLHYVGSYGEVDGKKWVERNFASLILLGIDIINFIHKNL